MKTKILMMLINLILSSLKPEHIKSFADMILDFVEDRVLGSASTVDDKLILPVIAQIRAAFNIPDDD